MNKRKLKEKIKKLGDIHKKELSLTYHKYSCKNQNPIRSKLYYISNCEKIDKKQEPMYFVGILDQQYYFTYKWENYTPCIPYKYCKLAKEKN
jgi:hypothetical protein